MTISASLTGRVRNTSLPKTRPLLPLFEAVVNAIQSVDNAHESMESARITVEIVRDPGLFDDEREARLPAPITGFVIRDNGEGFHERNMESFKTLDSEYKLDRGGRGVGRLLWLKAFDQVTIRSCYRDGNGRCFLRSFQFSEPSGISGDSVDDSPSRQTWVEVRLEAFRDPYRRVAPKTAGRIAASILEHCLWYFVRSGGAPDIKVIDGSESVDLTSLYEDYIRTAATIDRISVKGLDFDLVHLRLKVSSKTEPQLSWCAASRVVITENISGRVVGLHGKLGDAEGEFVYAGFLMSPYLDDNVRPERSGFNIPDVTDGALDEEDPSLSDIRAAALVALESHLLESLKESRRAARDRVEKFVANKEPRYRPILRQIDEEKLSVDPEMSDRDLEFQLHRALAEIERELLAEGQRVVDASSPPDEDYDRRLRDYLERVEDVKKSDLAAYVSRRRVILDLFARAIRRDENGDYANEDVIHSLIMPMRTTSDEAALGASNLWIIDERLAFHNYLASDKPIRAMPITGSDSRLEPDLLALRVFDGPILVSEGPTVAPANLVVVEFKRPMRNDANAVDNPIVQSLRYLKKVREGKVMTRYGRPVAESENVPGFCYIVADLTPSMQERCLEYGLKLTDDRMGYFGYNDNYRAYIEVFSLDRLLALATQRNRAFFERLGLPAT